MPLTPSQQTTLANDIAANANLIPAGQPWSGSFVGTAVKDVPHSADGAAAVAGWYSQTANPAFWVWQGSASLETTGMAIKMSDVGNLTTANSTRLQTSFLVRPGGFNPAVQDDRALFGGLFSVAGASGTRANLIAAWQRKASYVEKLLAAGTGTQVTGDLNSDGTVTAGSPAVMAFEGDLLDSDIRTIWGI